MFKVLTCNNIAEVGLKGLPETSFSVNSKEDAPDAILVRSANLLEASLGENLLCIARAGAGTNNIPIEKCSAEGVVVFNTPGANANAVRELALCALILSSRDIVSGVNWVRALKGDDIAAQVEKGKSAFTGPELLGKTLGVIGLGAIGGGIANAAHHLGMEVYGVDPYISVNAAWGLSRSIHRASGYADIYALSDYITLHVPVTKETRNMINADTIAQMKTGVRIINLARGDLVDHQALLSALDSGKISCYVTDFPTAELLRMPNVVPIPHLGASTPESEDNCAVMACNQLREYMLYGNIQNSVNFPDVSLPLAGVRLCVIHQNIPNMLSMISSSLSAAGINIENMVSKSKGDLAYTVLDVGGPINSASVDCISRTEGILRVRVITP